MGNPLDIAADENEVNNITNNIKNDPNLNQRKYYWIDQDIDSEQNIIHYDNLFLKRNIDCKKFYNVEEGFASLIKEENNFKNVYIMVSGRLFQDLYYKIKNNLGVIKYSPTILVFTAKEDLFINQLKLNNMYYNNDLFDTKLIFTKAIQIEDFIDNIIREGKDLSFDILDNLCQLIIPTYYSCLLDDVSNAEINYFHSFIQRKFLPPSEEENQPLNQEEQFRFRLKKGNKEIHEVLNEIINKKTPKEILIKFWLKLYSKQSEFYYELNKSLRKKDNQTNFYYPFIKLCYEGIKKGFLQPYDKEIYRCSKIGKKEFEDLLEKCSASTIKKSNYPNIIVFSRSFLSFSSNIEKAKKFRGSTEDTYCIMYIIKEMKNKNNLKNHIFNAKLDEFSDFHENEVLVFPWTCLTVVNIKQIKEDHIDYQITLNYLGNYSDIQKKLGENFFDKIQMSNFAQELMESGITKTSSFISTWVERKKGIIKLDKICFFLDNEKDFICFADKTFYVISINSEKETKIILTKTIHNDQIIDIIKLQSNKICSFSKEGLIKIIKLSNNYQDIENVIDVVLPQEYAKNVIFLNNEDSFICLKDNNNISFYKLIDGNYNFDKIISKEDEVLSMKKLSDERIVYITENKDGNKLINFLNINKLKKEEKFIEIKEENAQKLKVINLIIFKYYILIAYNHRIDIINCKEEKYNIQSLKYFNFEINNIIQLSSDRLILSFYDDVQKESIIREHLLRKEDLKKNLDRFDCIGQGKLKSNKIDNIVRIKESKILINVKQKYYLIYERKNEISDLIKESLWAISNTETITEKSEKINIDNIDNNIGSEEKALIKINNYDPQNQQKENSEVINSIKEDNNVSLSNFKIGSSVEKNINLEKNLINPNLSQRSITFNNSSIINKNINNIPNQQNKQKEVKLLFEAKNIGNFLPESNKEKLKDSQDKNYTITDKGKIEA